IVTTWRERRPETRRLVIGTFGRHTSRARGPKGGSASRAGVTCVSDADRDLCGGGEKTTRTMAVPLAPRSQQPPRKSLGPIQHLWCDRVAGSCEIESAVSLWLKAHGRS